MTKDELERRRLAFAVKNEMADTAATYLRDLIQQLQRTGCNLTAILAGMHAELVHITAINFGGVEAATMCEQAASVVRQSPNLNPGSLESMQPEGTA
jgi:hypothetical protein